MANEPGQLCVPGCLDQDKVIPPATMRNIPNIMRRSVLSLKKTQASTAVKTASRLSNREANAALVLTRPIIPVAWQTACCRQTIAQRQAQPVWLVINEFKHAHEIPVAIYLYNLFSIMGTKPITIPPMPINNVTRSNVGIL